MGAFVRLVVASALQVPPLGIDLRGFIAVCLSHRWYPVAWFRSRAI
jgi:hypothetical protein